MSLEILALVLVAAAPEAHPASGRWISAAEAGVKADGTSDDGPALSKAIAAAVAAGADVALPAGTLNVASTVTIRNGADLRIVGAGNRKTYIRWTGAPGRPVLMMLNCYRTVIDNLSIDGTSPAASELILVENDDTAPDYKLPSTLNVFRDLRLVGGAYAIHFVIPPRARDVMNDQSRLERLVAARQTTAAVGIRGQNSKLHGFYECSFTESPVAVLVEDASGGHGAGGSFHWYGGYVVSSVTNFQIEGVSAGDGLALYSVNSESSTRFLTIVKTPQDYPVIIVGCRFSAAKLHKDGRAMILGALGPYTITGSHWGEQWQEQSPRFELAGPGPTAAIIDANVFGSINSVATDVVQRSGSGPFAVSARANVYRDRSGQRVLMEGSAHRSPAHAP